MAKGTTYKNLFTKSSKSTKIVGGVDLIKAELEVLLGFTRHTLFFGNNMGLDAERFIHLRNRLATFNLVKTEIETLLAKYGRVDILNLTMNFNKQNNTLEVDLMLSPRRSNSDSFNLSLTLGE